MAINTGRLSKITDGGSGLLEIEDTGSNTNIRTKRGQWFALETDGDTENLEQVVAELERILQDRRAVVFDPVVTAADTRAEAPTRGTITQNAGVVTEPKRGAGSKFIKAD